MRGRRPLARPLLSTVLALVLAGALSACGGRAVSRPGAVVAAPSPPLVVISIDGFRWDYLDRGLTPVLSRLASEGVRARGLVPAFPSKTFPNHYTLVTGLYPEHHGIVDNVIHDTALGAWFRIQDTAAVRDARWWGGEPIWATAERQGVRSAVMFWPGSEAAIGGVRPSLWRRYDARLPDSARVTQVVDWLDLPPDARPAVVLLYFSDTDESGHRFGPDSPRTDSAIARVDGDIGRLLGLLDARGLRQEIDLVVLSDHGMAATDTSRVVVLDDFVAPAATELIQAGPIVTLNPRPGLEDSVARALHRLPHTTWYRRADTPLRWHYRANARIPAWVGVADEGWQVVERLALQVMPRAFVGGNHGFDNALLAMRGILVASGPAFRRGATVDALQNVHVYDLLCRAAGLRPAPNDGSVDSVATFFARP
jgi:predicted AlkP superfamily pyrophosphatase or phosphodiesterase